MSNTTSTIYDTLDQDKRIEALLKADELGCTFIVGGTGWTFKVPKGEIEMFSPRNALIALMSEYGLVQTDQFQEARDGDDDPSKCFYGAYNLPPDPPAYNLYLRFEVRA